MRKKKTQVQKPSYEDLYAVMKEICSVNNIWAFCLKWKEEKPKQYNKFMELCAYFIGDDYFLKQKTNDTEFMYNKTLKKDVLVRGNGITHKGTIVWWHPDENRWVNSNKNNFSSPKEHH